MRGRLVVVACSPQAARERVRPGMPLAEARAILGPASPVHCEPCDAEADQRTLARLAVWAQCFTPVSAVEEPDSLLLDISGCAPLFAGEKNLATRALSQLREMGMIARAAVADTPGAAWALAHHHGGRCVVVPAGRQRQALRPLPLAALRLPEKIVRMLGEFDIVRIEQLQHLPRSVLPGRFGPDVLRRLDEAMGDIAEPLVPVLAGEPLEGTWTLEYPCLERRQIEKILAHLLEHLLARLRPRQLGIQRLLCKLHAGEEARTLTVGLLHPSASLDYLLAMTHLHLDRVSLRGDKGTPPVEITAVSVHALQVAPLEFFQEVLFTGDARAERGRELPLLVEQLSNRLGKDAVLRPRLCAEAQPEFAWRYEPWLEPAAVERRAMLGLEAEPARSAALVRPVLLKEQPIAVAVLSVVPAGPPLRFEWNQHTFPIVRCWGPERIHTGWWRGHDIRRDYYLVETPSGTRYWLFRCTSTWFLHGAFG